MKIRKVTFRNYGPFEEKSLDLSGGNPGLHVVYGPNEAGKSSALRGLGYFLFGFPPQNEDNFLYEYRRFRTVVEFVSANGAVVQLIRRKGNRDTLRADDDHTVVSESVLLNAIGNLTCDQFKMLFGLDATGLADGGRLIAAGEGDLGESPVDMACSCSISRTYVFNFGVPHSLGE